MPSLPVVPDLPAPYGPRAPAVDRLIADLATGQHGIVATWQLHALGVTPKQIRVRAEAGRWHRLHRGVYAVGHLALTEQARLMAAVLALGPDAVLSHRSAAALWRIRQHRGRTVELTTPGHRRDRRELRIHESATLEGDVTVVDGIPVTTVARTLTDLADVVAPSALKRALETAERLDLVDRARLTVPPGRRRVVRGAHTFTRSQAEALLHAQFGRWGVEVPETNQQVGRWEVDFLWRDAGVVLELDFYATHGTRFAYVRDREKTAWLEEHGLRVLRIDGEHLDPAVVRRRLRALLATGAGG